jgi:hypothetical protein
MSFKSKVVKIGEHDVNVGCERMEDQTSPSHRVRFTAEVEGTTYSHTMTVGPEDGPVSDVSAEQVQADVDAARQYAASHAHFHHKVKTIIPSID